MLNPAVLPQPRTHRVPPRTDAVAQARTWIREVLCEWDLRLDELALMDVELAACEVISNSVIHAATESFVTVRWSGAWLRVEVTDADPALPRAGVAGAEDESGRGLLLVSRLASAWGVLPTRCGKTVWFEYDVATGAPQRDVSEVTGC